jgi:hypothetical protein
MGQRIAFPQGFNLGWAPSAFQVEAQYVSRETRPPISQDFALGIRERDTHDPLLSTREEGKARNKCGGTAAPRRPWIFIASGWHPPPRLSGRD